MTESKNSTPVILYAASALLCLGVMTVSGLLFLAGIEPRYFGANLSDYYKEPLSETGAYCLIALAISAGSLLRAASGFWQRSH